MEEFELSFSRWPLGPCRSFISISLSGITEKTEKKDMDYVIVERVIHPRTNGIP